MTDKLFVNVILPLRVEGVFTYSVPPEWALQAHVGKRAVVQFGKRKIYTALIVSVHQQATSYETKPILSILDEQAIVTEHQLKLWEWISRYYFCTLGETMKAALPSGLKLESQSVILPGINFNDFNPSSEEEYQIKKLLEQKESALISDIQDLLEKKNVQPLLNKLLKSNIIQIEESLAHRYIPKKVEYIDLAIDIESEEHLNAIFAQLTKAPKQSDVLLSYFALNNSQYHQTIPVKKEDLLKKSKDNGSATKKLIEKGIFKTVYFEESRVFNKIRELKLEKNKLIKTQEEALLSIENQFKEKNVVLLHGVTSSGKTEIYIHLIEKVIQQGQQVYIYYLKLP